MNLHTLTPADGSVKKVKRIGRGQGSGHGRKSTRGSKGAGQRSGTKNKRGFEGGQMPLQRRLPKFGFKNINRVEFQVFNLDSLQKIAEKYNTTEFTKEFFVTNGLAHKDDKIKILGRGAINKAINVTVDAVSEKAKQIIEAAGGKTTLLVFERAADAIEVTEAKKEARKEAMKAKPVAAPKVEEATKAKAPSKAKKVAEPEKPSATVDPKLPLAESIVTETAPKAEDVTSSETINPVSDEKKEGPSAPDTDETEKANDN